MYAILTPTYFGHLQFIKKYLESVDKYVLDKENVKLYIVISLQDKEAFSQIHQQFKNLNIHVVYFDFLLIKNGINIPEKDLLAKFDKFTYQTLKKLYAILTIPEDICLIVDSESMFISPVRVADLFEQFSKKKPLIYSDISKRSRCAPFFSKLVNTHSKLLDIPKFWFLEHVNWFFEKHIIQDLVNELGSPYEIALKANKLKEQYSSCDLHVFEGLLRR